MNTANAEIAVQGKAVSNGIEKSDDLPALVGRTVRRLRTRQGYSLERLSKQSGVSRAMLGQIELGKSAPTISLLWKVATALNVPFAELLGTQEPREFAVMRQSDAKLLTSSQGHFSSRALFPFDNHRGAEFYEIRIAPLHREVAAAHSSGTRENIVVVKGVVEVIVGASRPVTLSEGDALMFEADVPHVYKNLIATEAVLYLVMTYGANANRS